MKSTGFIQRWLGGKPASPWPAQLDALREYSMASLPQLQHLCGLARDLDDRGIAGDFVECGVYNGGTAASMACGLRHGPRKFWLYDSFAGMPESSTLDGPDAAKYVGQGVGSAERAREAMHLAGVNDSHLVIRPGWFEATFQEPLPERVALLHVDCDWYESVMLTLRTFFDRVAEGGVVILDDFGHWEGAREAFYDFIAERQLKPLVERSGHSRLFWIKGRASNREHRKPIGAPVPL